MKPEVKRKETIARHRVQGQVVDAVESLIDEMNASIRPGMLPAASTTVRGPGHTRGQAVYTRVAHESVGSRLLALNNNGASSRYLMLREILSLPGPGSARWVLAAPPAAAVASERLEHVRRYDNLGKHVMSAETVLGHYALVTTSSRLCLVDLELQQTESGCLSQLDGLDSTTTTTGPDGYYYVNLRNAGFAIAYLDESTLTLTLVDQISKAGVFFEKMSVVGDRLYVAAHSAGIRVFDISARDAPALIGSLTEGFDDAWDIAVTGDVAYVADGAGGLKIVDLSDEALPVIVAGENTRAVGGCVANDDPETEVAYETEPGPGTGSWLLARGVTANASLTYNSLHDSQLGDRDAGIEASPISCP